MADGVLPDPLAGWTPSPVAAQPTLPDPLAPPPAKGILDTSYKQVPSTANSGGGIEWAPEVQRIIAAGREAYENSPPVLTYDAREALKGPGRPADAVGPFIADLLSTGRADLSALGAGAWQAAHELMEGTHVPANLQRDLPFLAAATAAAPVTTGGIMPEAPVGPIAALDSSRYTPPLEPAGPLSPQMTPSPSLTKVYLDEQAQRRATAPYDPVSQATIDFLQKQKGIQPIDIPSPPSPSALTPGPTPAPPPPGGLLNVSVRPQQPVGGGGLLGQPMSADEMLAQSQAHFAPVDAQIRQGATIPADAADAVRQPLIDQIPTDPQKGVAVGDTPLTKLGTDYQGYQGQPMSYDAAVALDRRLTSEKQAAAAQKGGADLARQIGNVQDSVRDAMDNIPDPDDGDASALAQAKLGRQSYLQYRKQSQLEDIDYNASLLPEDKQDASRRGQITSMLRNDNKMRGWFPDETAALENQLKAGNIGPLKSWGLSTIKPVSQALGGTIGGSVGGPVGAIIGGNVGGELGAGWSSSLRRRMSGLDLGPVSQQLSANMPPPPAGWQPSP
jgi:hypothetical protein